MQKTAVASLSSKKASTSTGGTKTRSKKVVKQEEEPKGKAPPAEWKVYAAQFDVVLTTYNVLTKELNIAKAPVKRPRREIATYQADDERFRSPLILVEYVPPSYRSSRKFDLC